jgi:hypothetical protein
MRPPPVHNPPLICSTTGRMTFSCEEEGGATAGTLNCLASVVLCRSESLCTNNNMQWVLALVSESCRYFLMTGSVTY